MFYSKRNVVFNIILLVVLALKCSACAEYVELKTKQGVLSGTVEESLINKQNYYAFRGVPFAKPPIDDLRFLPPRPNDFWEGVLEAHINKPTCMQYSIRMRIGDRVGISGSEDCLYLNVFTPSLEIEQSLPVVVFDYNDDLKTGFNGTDEYSPDFFIEEDVVVVTISHRLGVFGYLTTEDNVIPSNNGIRDFILGLEWIKEHIKDFGGNPKRVTLMGSRGGAVLADILLYVEKARGLFHSVILQSGTALEPIFFSNVAKEKAFNLGVLFDIETDSSEILLKELQKIDANDLLLKHFRVFSDDKKEIQMTVSPFGPVVDTTSIRSLLTSLPEKSRIVNDVPVLIGFNSREGLDLVVYYIFQPRLIADINEFYFHFPIRPNFRFDTNSSLYEDALNEIRRQYLKKGYFSAENILEYADYIGDALMIYAINKAVEKFKHELESPVYFYMFDFRGAFNKNSEYIARNAISSIKYQGATINDELCYLHLCSTIKKNYQNLLKLVSKQPEIKLLQKMVRMWTNFAKTGNPTPDDSDSLLDKLSWEPVDKKSDDTKYLHICRKMHTSVNPLAERVKFWDDFLEKYASLAIDGVVKDIDVDEPNQEEIEAEQKEEDSFKQETSRDEF